MEQEALAGFVPASLAARMREALAMASGGAPAPEAELRAAVACLREALRLGDDREAAIELLAADALLTSASAAAAAAGPPAAVAFAERAARALAGLVEDEAGQ